jgi:hypothetical protein
MSTTSIGGRVPGPVSSGVGVDGSESDDPVQATSSRTRWRSEGISIDSR